MPALAWAWLICKDGRFSGPKIVDNVQVHFLFAQLKRSLDRNQITMRT